MIYLLITVYILVCIVKYDIREDSQYKKYHFVVILILLICLSGFSYRMGGDRVVLENEYNDYYSITSEEFKISVLFEYLNRMPGWVLMNSICLTFFDSWIFFKIIHAIIVNVLVFRFVWKECRYVFSIILFYFVLIYFRFNFENMRDAIGIGIFLNSLCYYRSGKWLKYYLMCLLAFLFHDSALVVLFLPLLKFWNYSKVQVTILLGLICGIIVFRDALLNIFLAAFSNEYIEMRVKYYLSHYESESSFAFYSNMLLNVFFPLVVLLYIKRKKVDTPNNIFSLGYIVVYVFSLVMPIFYRFNNYFILFYYILIIDIIAYLFLDKWLLFKGRKNAIIYLSAILVFVLFKARMYMLNYGDTNIPSYVQYYPYISIFEETKLPDRETINDDAQFSIN